LQVPDIPNDPSPHPKHPVFDKLWMLTETRDNGA
jgi:hypothetical protein